MKALALLVGLAMLAGACSSKKSGGSSPNGGSSAKGVKGGTLKVLLNSDVDYLDTATSYSTLGFTLSRAYARELYSFDSTATGDKITVPVPDLADGPPQISADGLTYTFKIRSGVKWSPPVNRALTAQDFVTAVERMYDKTNPSGGQSYSNLIAGASDFGSGKAKTISGLQAVGDNTLKITLKAKAADFLSILALGFFAPAPKEYASKYKVGPDYSKHVAGVGPYMLQSYVPNKKILFVRNPNWDPATDPLRKAWVDKITITEGSAPEAIEQQIETGDQDLSWDTSPPPATLQRLSTDPKLAKQFGVFLTGCTRYFVMGTSAGSGAIAKLPVRQAVNYALDKIALQRARGGPFAGDPATTILTPTLLGYQKFDLYPTPNFQGDPNKAKQLLASAGYPNGLTLNYVGGSTGKGPAVTTALQTALARANIKLNIKTFAGFSIYTDSLGLPAKRVEHQIGQAGWCPDYPGDGARSFIVPLLDGRSILPSGNSNYGEYNNPKVNSLIDQALTESDQSKRGALWGQIDKTIMADAPWAPFLYDKTQELWSSRVKNYVFSPWLSENDPTALWLDPNTP